MTDPIHDDPVARLAALAEMLDFEALEAAWMAVLDDEAFDTEAAMAVLRVVAAKDASDALESLVWILASTWAEQGRAEAALDVVWQVADQLPNSGVLREEIAGLYRRVCHDAPGIDTLVAMALGRDDLPLATALARMERLLDLAPGTFVIDPRRRHPGCVLGVDAERLVLKVSFGESERGYDAVSIESIEPGDPDDFRALVAFAPERLADLAENDPAELARVVLKTCGPEMKFRDFKSCLEPVIRPAAWSKWWSGARDRVRRSPHLDVPAGTQPTLAMRVRPRSFEDRVRETFDEAATPRARLAFVLAYLDETGHDPAAEAEVLTHFAKVLARAVKGTAKTSPAKLVGSLAVLARMHRSHAAVCPAPEADATALLAGVDLPAVLAPLTDARLAECVLAFVREALPEAWPQVFASALPSGAATVCEPLASALTQAGHHDLLAGAAAEIMRRPDECRAAIFWLWTAVTADRFAQAFAGVDRTSLTIRFLLASDRLGRDARDDRGLRPLVSEVRAAVGARDGGPLRAVLESADDTQAKDIRAAIERNAALTDVIRSRVLDLIRKIHPAHFAVAVLQPWEDDQVIYTTPAALNKQEEVYGELVTVKVLENQRAIAQAAEHGDISENAEFAAALEERDRLAERAQRLQADIAKAIAITPSMAAGDTVTIGSRVRARNAATGREETFTFLGPWDSDVENHIYYYRAPLPLAFMGKRAGDTVTYGDGANAQQWEVLEVGPGL